MLKNRYFKYMVLILLLTFVYSFIINSLCGLNIKIYMSANKVTNSHSTYEVYYDSGSGFNEKNVIYNDIDVKNNLFVANADIEHPLSIKKVRFDPPSNISKKITIKKIVISNCFFKYAPKISYLYKNKHISYFNDIENPILTKDGLMLDIVGFDPGLQLLKHIKRVWVQIYLLSLLLSFITLFLYNTLLNRYSSKIFNSQNIIKTYLTSISLFFISIVTVKTVVTFIAKLYYSRDIAINDIFFTYISDLLIATLVAFFGAFLLYLINRFKKFTLAFNVLLLVLAFTLFVASIFYLLSGYIYLEWGAFVEPQHIKELINHKATDEFSSLFFRTKTYIFLVLVAIIIFLSSKVSKFIYSSKIRFTKKYILLISSIFLTLLFALKYTYKYKPSTQSPLLLMLQKTDKYSHYIKANTLNNIDISGFNPLESNRSIPKEYLHLKGVAKDMNIVIYIMESVRKKNVSIYGYKRNTMPELNKLVKKGALVFHNAYVNQPRSCKTMSSLLMGTYPDPRLEAIVWNYYNIKNPKDSFISKLEQNGYSLYFGTMQANEGGDHFGDALRALTKHITIQDPVYLLKNNSKNRDRLDERLLIDSFLSWSKKKKKKFTAILWTKSAHMPYRSPIKKWKEKNDEDKYDNSLLNLDRALKSLIDGLKEQKKLENTLIIVFGDHGEALGDKLDWGHGNYLYEHSLNIPFIIYNKKIAKTREDLYQRFQIKDIASTIMYLLGLDSKVGQSINIFSKKRDDTIYLSNVHQDYKIGVLYKDNKYIYRPKFDLKYLYNLTNDPNEESNYIGKASKKEIHKLKENSLKWYKYQIEYLNNNIYKRPLK